MEQARERSYHRALLLSKDKDTGESDEGEHAFVKGKVSQLGNYPFLTWS